MSYVRRLPVYLILDTSESMAGPAIEAVEKGVRALIDSLMGNPQALETAYLSVITFNRKAQQVVPLTELLRFVPPRLAVRSGSALGGALRMLLACVRKEVVRTTATTKGDYKPLVFLLTDGQPTDDWEAAVAELRAAGDPKVANIYAIGCGPDVDPDVLREVSDIVLMLRDLTPEGFKRFFVWLSASVQSASVRLDAAAGSLDMPPPPPGVGAPDARDAYDPTPRQVFLHAVCQQTGKPYLMRFARRERDGRYEAIAGHVMEVREADAGTFLPPINTADLDGCPTCPCCENEAAGVCPCGTLFCNAVNPKGPVVCPGCRSQLSVGHGGSFDVRRSMG